MILVVDHYDSFTYNLVQLIETLGATTEVVKSDAEPAEALVAREPAAVVLSPGPGRPEDAGCFTELLRILPEATPVLGVCLGHQAMGIVAGARVDRELEASRQHPLGWTHNRAIWSSPVEGHHAKEGRQGRPRLE